jgi:hypothetical protein
MKKLKLNELKLQSFVTGMNNNLADAAKGGNNTNNKQCSAIDACPSQRGCTIDTCI